MPTKATLETEESTVMVEVKADCMNISSLMESVIEPLLLAAGYLQAETGSGDAD